MIGESSKKAEKRIRKEREAIIAVTMDERRNASFRILDECSTSPHVESHDMEGVVDSTQVPKKKTRGASKLKMHDKGKQKCDEIDFNERNQHVRLESVKLSTLEGILVRETVPITIERWPDIPEEVKDKLWACVKLRFKIHDCHRKHIMQKFGRLWRSHKSELSRKIRPLGKSAKLAHNIVLTKPDNVEMVEWKAFVKQRTSKEFKAKSKRFRAMRKKQTLFHTISHKGYAQLEDEMRRESRAPSSISRVDVWIKGHTRKEGKSMNEVLDVIVKNVQELHKASTDEGPKSIKDDVIFHTFGPEHRGSVRGLGFRAIPSKVDAQVHQNEHVRKLESEVLDLEQQLDEIRAMLIKEKRQNDGTNPSQRSSDLLQSTPHDNLPTSVNEVGSVTESIEAMKLSKRGGSSIVNLPTGLDMDQSNGVSSLANVKCKLLHWEGSNLVVAKGQIASRDPKSKVHHATLGALCWKVWVNHVTVNVPLFRSTREMYDLQDAIGSIVAWPSQFIILD
ncbi:uncharacterized protein LOC114307107 isoform X1 [Camellia sinensis]|uniref:uncharacterized protein LOC114307107 isoform X1 n=2 Tax=Camellia sinensis TaxID=4442 RepID=UPI0010363765|nr:uncharacterized protein LOC114307107 isoform X1 [Camellia sinensis]XP_028108294.1 uncharacterized protein LOC114307107 isoform X1 [Camellia sinensis]